MSVGLRDGGKERGGHREGEGVGMLWAVDDVTSDDALSQV